MRIFTNISDALIEIENIDNKNIKELREVRRKLIRSKKKLDLKTLMPLINRCNKLIKLKYE